MQQPADKNTVRVLPVPVKRKFGREVTKEEIEEAAAHYFRNVPNDFEHLYAACVPVVNNGCSGRPLYITAAFRCSFGNQSYLFMHHEYLLMNYDPATLDGEVIDGPKRIFQGIPCLEATIFGDYGIYCAFGLNHRNEAFIFSGKWCALIGYARDGSDFKILKSPTLIDRMFPFLIGTAFENHVGAAFESATDNEAYLFRGIEYVVINYADGCLISDKQTFDCLKDTVFEGGFDAAFASHVPGEAFIFKDDSYALINFVDRCIIGDVKKIHPNNCPFLCSVLPRKNTGVKDEDFVVFAIDDEDYSDLD